MLLGAIYTSALHVKTDAINCKKWIWNMLINFVKKRSLHRQLPLSNSPQLESLTKCLKTLKIIDYKKTSFRPDVIIPLLLKVVVYKTSWKCQRKIRNRNNWLHYLFLITLLCIRYWIKRLHTYFFLSLFSYPNLWFNMLLIIIITKLL